MTSLAYGTGFILIISIGILYEKWRSKNERQQQQEDYNNISKYLLSESSLAKSKKPILWIPIHFEYNARQWQSFGSRSSWNMNKPYISLCIRSIIERCSASFQICIVDDASYNNILPGWTHNIQQMADPLRTHMRQLALAKLLYYYGGMIIPPSFICLRDLYPVYNIGLAQTSMFCGELPATSNVSDATIFFPSTKIMGCVKESYMMKRFISFIGTEISGDYTNELEFIGTINKWFYDNAMKSQLMIIYGTYFGVKDRNLEPISLETLIGDGDGNFHHHMLGIYIPEEQLSMRNSLKWVDRMNTKEVLESDTVIGKYLLASNYRREN